MSVATPKQTPQVLVCQHCQQSFYCRRPFRPKRGARKYCSHNCSAIAQSIATGRYPWREPELALLERLAGQVPFPDIVQRLQDLDRQRGWPVRTRTAIGSRMKEMGLRCRCTLDNFTCIELARILNIGVSRVRNTWKRRHGLPVRRIAKNQNAISLKEFRVWAANNPHCLAGIDRDCLLWVLDNPELADYCNKLPVAGQGKPKKVRRLDTGEEYPTLEAAAKAIFVSPTSLCEALKNRRVCAGIYWEVI